MKNTLPELRAQRGWTQGDLAAKLAVSRQTVFGIAALFALPIEGIFQSD